MAEHTEHTITIKVYSDTTVPNWLVEKTFTEQVEKIFRHHTYGSMQGEVVQITKEETMTVFETILKEIFG